MILYHASTVYHTLCCLVHKLSIRREEDAVLFIVEYMLPTNELHAYVKKLKSMHWFHDIRIVPEKNFRFQRGFELTEKSSKEDIEQVIQNICNSLEKWYKAGFTQFDEYNIAADNWSIGIYLLYHRIPYNYFEDACGIMCDTERFLRIIRNFNETNYIISNYLGGVGRSSTAKQLYCSLKSQSKDFYDDRAIDFTIYDSILRMNPLDVNQLLDLYGGDTYPINQEQENVLFLSQRLPTLTIQKIEVQERMTVLIMDYFCNGCNIIVKPHPKDVWIDYKKLIPECHVVNRSVPSELLPFIIKKEENNETKSLDTMKFSLCITPNSTSIHGLAHIAETTMYFGNDFEVNYEHLHIYYIVSKLIQVVYSNEHILTDTTTKGYMKKFFKRQEFDIGFDEQFNIKNNYICIKSDSNKESDCYDIEGIETIIFLNEESSYAFLLEDMFRQEEFRIIEYEVMNTTKEKIEVSGSIWINIREERVRDKVKEWKGSCDLKHTGSKLNYQLKESNELRIARGKIKALEYAMQHPSDKNKKTKKEETL